MKTEVQLIMEPTKITEMLMNYLRPYNIDHITEALYEKYFTMLNENGSGLWFYGPVDLENWLNAEWNELIVVGPNDDDYDAILQCRDGSGIATIEAEIGDHFLVRY